MTSKQWREKWPDYDIPRNRMPDLLDDFAAYRDAWEAERNRAESAEALLREARGFVFWYSDDPNLSQSNRENALALLARIQEVDDE